MVGAKGENGVYEEKQKHQMKSEPRPVLSLSAKATLRELMFLPELVLLSASFGSYTPVLSFLRIRSNLIRNPDLIVMAIWTTRQNYDLRYCAVLQCTCSALDLINERSKSLV